MYLVDRFHGILASLGLRQKEANIWFLGLDNEGKNTLLHMLKDEWQWQGEAFHHQPRQNLTSVEFSRGKIKFKAFNLGGLQIARRVWQDYYAQVDAVVYVVDAFGIERFDDSRNEVDALLSDESLANVPLLIFGNLNNFWRHFNGPHWEWYNFAERDLLEGLGLTGRTTGKGKVNLADSNVRPLEVFRMLDCSKGFEWMSQYIKYT